MSENRQGIGQHRGDGSGAPNSGQRERRDPAANVGNLSGGEKNNGPVPASKPGADISTQTGVARGPNDGTRRFPAS